MNHLTAPNRPKIHDQKWGSIHSDTTPFLIVDFRRFRVGQMVHIIFSQILAFFLLYCFFFYEEPFEIGVQNHDVELNEEVVENLAHFGMKAIFPLTEIEPPSEEAMNQ